MKNSKKSWLHWTVEKRPTGWVLVVRAGADNKTAEHEALIAGHAPTVKELEAAKAATAKQLLNK